MNQRIVTSENRSSHFIKEKEVIISIVRNELEIIKLENNSLNDKIQQ
jgi:hypothetical protein